MKVLTTNTMQTGFLLADHEPVRMTVELN